MSMTTRNAIGQHQCQIKAILRKVVITKTDTVSFLTAIDTKIFDSVYYFTQHSHVVTHVTTL